MLGGQFAKISYCFVSLKQLHFKILYAWNSKNVKNINVTTINFRY